MCEISVIVPVYNVENYLKECLDSVIRQTYTDFELICIDDNSTDHSLYILQEYELIDKRIKVIHNKQNMGLSVSRNIGINESKGNYILFLDSDDYLNENALEVVYHEALTDEIEVLSFSSKSLLEKETGYQYSGIRNIIYPNIMNGPECFVKQNSYYDYKCPVWQYFYNADFIKSNNFEFIKGIYHEDIIFTFMIYMNAHRIKIINDTLHNYRIRKDSITDNGNMVKRITSIFHSYFECIDYSLREQNHDEVKEAAIKIQLDILKDTIKDYYKKCSMHEKKQCKQLSLSGFKGHCFEMITDYKNHLYLSEEGIKELKEAKKLYLYGAGVFAEKWIIILNELNIDIDGILVTSLSDNTKKIFGYSIYQFDEIIDSLKEITVIPAVSDKYFDSIITILKSNNNVKIFNHKMQTFNNIF